jgi:FixJ family two-component response regulator
MISIVDDDKSVREATSSLVRSLGYNAVTFCSAEEFLKSEQVRTTMCLITDIQMPGLSGIELQECLISNGRDIPVIFITAFPDERLQGRLLRNGAIGYLQKPFKEACLIKCIDMALNGKISRGALV